MWRFIKQLFTWWNGETIGTRMYTAFRGEKVGEDEFGNIYYQNKSGDRRWVVYHAYSEASQVPAEWHGWLHHSFDNRPGNDPLPSYEWELPHKENQTGTVNAYAPKGSMFNSSGERVASDYEAWTPGA